MHIANDLSMMMQRLGLYGMELGLNGNTQQQSDIKFHEWFKDLLFQ